MLRSAATLPSFGQVTFAGEVVVAATAYTKQVATITTKSMTMPQTVIREFTPPKPKNMLHNYIAEKHNQSAQKSTQTRKQNKNHNPTPNTGRGNILFYF